jgi:hypothetical protein
MSDRYDESRDAAQASKRRMLATLDDVRERLRPASLSREMVERAKGSLGDAGGKALDAAKSRPAAIAGVAAAALLFLFRKPIFGAIKRLTKEK